MTFLFERVSPDNAWHLVLFGAGHVAAALVPILATLRCQVDVVDPRGEWIGRIGDFPNVRKHQPARYEDMVELVGAKSFVLSITQGHSTDRPVLTEVLRRHPEIPYVGVIGSASKRAVLMRELAEDGIDEALRGKVVCPMGLKIGTNDPAEIALSIVAQLLQVRG